MAKNDHNRGPAPPAPQQGSEPSRNFGGYRIQDVKDFEEHAREIQAVTDGVDKVEVAPGLRARTGGLFEADELSFVRTWVQQRPLEQDSAAAATVPYPRMWATHRGRYARFKLAGLGLVGLLRARPTW